jgi:hypothetical protein
MHFSFMDGVLFNKNKTTLLYYLLRTKSGNYTIPSSVTTIGESAFYDCRSLTSITIPDGVTTIGSYAFYYCSNLTSIAIPEGVTTIGESTFDACSSLTSITIPNSVTTIGRFAFYYCSSLTSITIPEGVTTIGKYAFSDCRSLTSITIPDGVTTIGESAFYYCSSLTSITIPEGVTTIGERTFSSCRSLTSITIPDGVTTIGSYAFSYCSSLTSITIPNSVTSIGNDAFYGCSSLTTIQVKDGNMHFSFMDGVLFNKNKTTLLYCLRTKSGNYTIPSSVTTIGERAFYDCSSLTSITIPKGVTTIGSYAFEFCRSLTLITIPEGVTTIGERAFSSCSSLTSITIPDGVTTIGEYAFYGCSSLTSITIPNSVTTIGRSAFSDCSSLTSIAIPESVTTIESSTFSYCRSLTSITIPEGVTTIGGYAFYYCISLTEITVNWTSTPPSIDRNVFFNNYQSFQVSLHIPVGTKHIYELADFWNFFKLITPGYLLNIGTFTGGSVTANKSVYNEGDPVTLTVVPDADYIPDYISAHKINETGTSVALSGTNNSRTFVMPSYDVTVEATFRNLNLEAINIAGQLIEAATYGFAQAEANTEETVKTRLAAQINALPGISDAGIDPVTASAITISAFSAAITDGAAGNFTFTVSLSKGNTTATTASLNGTITATVNAQTPVISIQPQDETVESGSSVTLTVIASASDGGTLSYQWYSHTSNSNTDGTAIDNATGNSYSPPTSAGGSIWYYVVITNTNTGVDGAQTAIATSRAASVTVNTHRIIVTPANNGTVTANPEIAVSGETVTLTVTPAGDYELDRISAYKTGETGTSVALSGTNNSRTFVMPSYDVTVEATFRNPNLEAINIAEQLIEAATYGFTQAEANTEETVKTRLAAQINVLTGISDTGIDPVTASAITINAFSAAVTGGTNGNFTFIVLLSKGNTTASTASLNGTITATPIVNTQTPVISIQPQDETVEGGSSVTLTVIASASDGGTLSYQWYSHTSNSNTDGTAISGATFNSYSPPTSAGGSIWYYVVITNTNTGVNGAQTAIATSRAASVTINTHRIIVAPVNNGTVTANPESATTGETVTLTVTPAGDYELDRISAYKADETGTAVPLYGAGNSRIFTMPACNVIIDAAFKAALSTGIEDVSLPKVSIYPNPVKHDLYIQSDYPVEKVEIYDQMGACVWVDNASTGKTDVSRLSAGIYYVRVYVNGAPENKKIIVWK